MDGEAIDQHEFSKTNGALAVGKSQLQQGQTYGDTLRLLPISMDEVEKRVDKYDVMVEV